MKSYETRIMIRARREQVWKILTDATAYPSWNSTIDKVEGTIAPGEDLKIWAKISPDRAFAAKVSAWEPSARMVWSFSAPLGFFKGARTFVLQDVPGGVEFRMDEVFGGWLSGPITKRMPDLQPTFDDWAACLKARAEAG